VPKREIGAASLAGPQAPPRSSDLEHGPLALPGGGSEQKFFELEGRLAFGDVDFDGGGAASAG
jgi:hypothetical protein